MERERERERRLSPSGGGCEIHRKKASRCWREKRWEGESSIFLSPDGGRRGK